MILKEMGEQKWQCMPSIVRSELLYFKPVLMKFFGVPVLEKKFPNFQLSFRRSQ